MAELIRKPTVENSLGEAARGSVLSVESREGIGKPEVSHGSHGPETRVQIVSNGQPKTQVTAELQARKNVAASKVQNQLQEAFNVVYSTAVNLGSRIANSGKQLVGKPVRNFWEALWRKANMTSNPPVPVAA